MQELLVSELKGIPYLHTVSNSLIIRLIFTATQNEVLVMYWAAENLKCERGVLQFIGYWVE